MATTKKTVYSSEAKPEVVAPTPDAIPGELKNAPRWVLWKLVPKDGKWSKVPHQRSSCKASSTDPTTWTTFDKAWNAFTSGSFDGIGFVLGDGFAGIDLDDSIDPDTGSPHPWAEAIVRVAGSYCEISPSGTGLKIFGRGKWNGDGNRWMHKWGVIEVYDSGRFFCVTGASHGPRADVADIQVALDHLADLRAAKKAPSTQGEAKRQEPTAGASLEDEALLKLAREASNGAKFSRLWDGDTSDHGLDDSAADLALCSMLAFWTGPDHARIDGLFRQSRLMRPKWDESRGEHTYGERTIAKALEGRTEFYKPSGSGPRVTFGGNADRAESGGTSAAGGNDPGEWPDLIPLVSAFTPPAFPVETLSPWMRDFALALAEEKQVPVDMAALLVLGVASAGISRKVVITPRPGWEREPCNLFIMCALEPGERKSQTFSAALRPVAELEKQLRDNAAPQIDEAEADRRVRQKRVDHLEGRVAKCEDAAERDAIMNDLRTAREELNKTVVPAKPILVVNDDTAEMLKSEICKQKGRLLVASPEAKPLENITAYSNQPNMDIWLCGHAGDDLKGGRVGRGREDCERPALTALFTPQPAVIEKLGETPEMRDRGFLGRWFFSLPVSQVGDRTIRSSPIPEGIRSRYQIGIRNLWLLSYANDETDEPHELVLTEEAQAELESFEAWREPQLRRGGEFSGMQSWANKLNGLCARVAAILHAADGALSGTSHLSTPVSVGTIRRAVHICREYAIPHARAAFNLMGESEAVANAKYLLAWVGRREARLSAFTQRDAYLGCRGRFETVEDLKPSLTLLTEHGYIRLTPEKRPSNKPGRHKSPMYEVNPSAFAQNDQNDQNSRSNDSKVAFDQFDQFARSHKKATRNECVPGFDQFDQFAAGQTVVERDGPIYVAPMPSPPSSSQTSHSEKPPAPSTVDADELARFDRRQATLRWLQEALSNGPRPESEVFAEAESAGLSIVTAALALRVEVYAHPADQSNWLRLRTAETESPPPPTEPATPPRRTPAPANRAELEALRHELQGLLKAARADWQTWRDSPAGTFAEAAGGAFFAPRVEDLDAPDLRAAIQALRPKPAPATESEFEPAGF